MTRLGEALERLRVALSRIWLRLLAFNVLLVFLPLAAVFTLQVYEDQLLDRQEQAMAQQGRLIAAALGESGPVDERQARELLRKLEGRTRARLRILDATGRLLADTSQLGPSSPTDSPPAAETEKQDAPEESLLYRIGASPFRFRQRFKPSPPVAASDGYSPNQPFDGPEVERALSGAYGADTRLTPGQRSVTLYSAIPIRDDHRVVGVALVSQSTFSILQDLYEVRLQVFKIFLFSIAAASILSLVVATTIARPLRRLRQETGSLMDARGRLTGAFAESRRRDEIGDLTRALRELSRRLGEHQERTRSFAADLSHEFKNPLASIRSAAEVLDVAENDRERERFLEMIRSDTARLERLLTSLRDLSVIDAGADARDSSRISFARLSEPIVEGWRARQGRGREVRLRSDGPEPWAQFSADYFAQVLDNLLDNAASFSPPDAPIEVETAVAGNWSELSVRDHGPGIPDQHLDRVFDRFFTYRPGEEPRADEPDEHSGLGLAIVKSIIESHGGQVTVENAQGGGARFTIRLPRAT